VSALHLCFPEHFTSAAKAASSLGFHRRAEVRGIFGELWGSDLATSGKTHIQQGQPILKGLQRKAAKDEADAEGAEVLLGKVVGIVLDVGGHRDSNAGDKASNEANLDGKKPWVLDAMRQGATDQGGGDVAERPLNGCPKLTTRDPRTTGGLVVHCGTQASGVSDDLADGDETGKSNGEFEAQDPVQSGAESQTAYGAEECFPGEGIMAEAASGSIEFNGQGGSGGNACEEAEERTEAKTIADSENHGVGNGSCEQPQRAMLAAQQIVGEVQTA